MDIIQQALEFATAAHEGQVRKYTNTPYIIHPINVAHTVIAYGGTEDMVCAALLHDVVEDTSVTSDQIHHVFGFEIGFLVDQLTDRSITDCPTHSRAFRKAHDRMAMISATPEAKTIKLADLLDNSQSIFAHDPNFAKVYAQEKRSLLDLALREGRPELWKLCDRILTNYHRTRK